MENFEKLVALLENAKADAEKFFVKGNKAAGTRVRKAMQDAKKLAQDVRTDVQSAKSE